MVNERRLISFLTARGDVASASIFTQVVRVRLYPSDWKTMLPRCPRGSYSRGRVETAPRYNLPAEFAEKWLRVVAQIAKRT